MLMPQLLHRAIEFHDSDLAAVAQLGASVVLSFSAIYIHESTGEPGVDPGFGWFKPYTLPIPDAHIASDVHLPATIAEGFIRLGDSLHQNGLPAVSGRLDGPIELSLVVVSAE